MIPPFALRTGHVGALVEIRGPVVRRPVALRARQALRTIDDPIPALPGDPRRRRDVAQNLIMLPQVLGIVVCHLILQYPLGDSNTRPSD